MTAVGVVTLELRTPAERVALDDIRRAGIFRTDEDAIRSALWLMGWHFKLELPPEVFAHRCDHLHAIVAADSAADAADTVQASLFSQESDS